MVEDSVQVYKGNISLDGMNRDDHAADPVNGTTPHEKGTPRDNRQLGLGP